MTGNEAVQQGLWLKDVFVFLAAAGLVVPLFHRLRMGAVLGFLIVGVTLGPYGLGQLAPDYPLIRYLTIEDRERAAPFAELGVMFLLFLIGLELSFARLWSLRRFVLGVGGLQFACSALVLGLVVAFSGTGAMAGTLLGLALAMSSTAVVMQLLEEQGRTATPLGRVVLSVLLFQDLMVAPLLFGTEILGRGGAIATSLLLGLLQAGAVIAAIAIAGRYLLRPVFRFAAKTGSRELIMAITVLIVVGIAGVTGAAGLSTALGAFLAGLLLGETEYRHQVEIDLEPFKGLLLGLFFVTVGMSLDIGALAQQAPAIVLAVLGLIAIKAGILFGVARAFGLGLGVATEVGMLLAQAGEFGFVLIGLSAAASLMPPQTAQFATAVVALSMILTPLGAALAARVGRMLDHLDHSRHLPDDGAAEISDHVVIGGYGRVGQTVGRILGAENVSFVAFDLDGDVVTAMRKAGHRVYFGDAGRPEMLSRAGGAQARAFVVTVNAPHSAERMVVAARRQQPDAVVLARAKDLGHAARLKELGAVAVVPEALEASLQLAGRLLENLGLPDEAVDRRLAQAREQESEALDAPRA